MAGDVALSQTARLGLLTNRSARTADNRWSCDALRSAGYRIAALFSPEHGLDAAAEAGEEVPHSWHGELPIVSLYGADTARIEEALDRIDALVIDLPDVGCRYYTYSWTVREALRRAAHRGLPVTLLDRPNPLGGLHIEGNIPDPGTDSVVCSSPVPVRHGLTVGELALWNRRAHDIDVDLAVVSLHGWRRAMQQPDIKRAWIAPSPALRRREAVLLYPGTCLIEGTNLSEGRGTSMPFEILGAPFIDGVAVQRRLERSELLTGAEVSLTSFVPASAKWTGERCCGLRLRVLDAETFRPVATGVALVAALVPEPGFAFGAPFFDVLAGTSCWRQSLEDGEAAEEIVAQWGPDVAKFRHEREAVLLYA